MNTYIPRLIEKNVREALSRGKSILLLGPRQTGKTTFIEQQIRPDISYSFARAASRQRYEHNPALLEGELEERLKSFKKMPLVLIDEVQKIPRVMDIVQHLIDGKLAQFILSGSSARKLKSGHDLNLLPGRVVVLTMTPILYAELPENQPTLENILLYGTLPGILTQTDSLSQETDLYSYVETYLEEEIRAEALVRNVGHFSRFLELAAGESAKSVNFTRLSQDIGISDTTIANYFQILEDCLVTLRVDPLTKSQTRRRLIKSPKYLFFDLGIRRAAANEGIRLPQKVIGDLFEHFIGNELIYYSRIISPQITVKYWRDYSGPEVDFVLDIAHRYVPIEVKWSDKPNAGDARNLLKFIHEYPQATEGYVVCRTPHRYKITENVVALPWQELMGMVSEIQT